ncbi:MAG: isochorismatase family protein [Desulfomonilia bacterium]|nr:isochorismatase family protein [Desulfomonilia bacterium]HPW68195.1 isochorismatase family protein [Deltaproteobacteria bacterium]
MNKFLLQAEDCAVMVIDIQEKLFAVMDERFRSLLIRNSRILVETAQALDMPIVVTEQYPKGMGGTILEIGEHIRGIQRYEKLYFSCYRDPAIRDRTDSLARKTVIVAGMETHVCVFQTVIDLLMAGYRVVIAGDAVSSRRELDRKEAIIEMRSAGALIYSTEMIAFMLLEKAGTTQFKRLAPFFK